MVSVWKWSQPSSFSKARSRSHRSLTRLIQLSGTACSGSCPCLKAFSSKTNLGLLYQDPQGVVNIDFSDPAKKRSAPEARGAPGADFRGPDEHSRRRRGCGIVRARGSAELGAGRMIAGKNVGARGISARGEGSSRRRPPLIEVGVQVDHVREIDPPVLVDIG